MDALKKSWASEAAAPKGKEAAQGCRRSERNAAAYRREKARSEKSGKVRTSDRTPQGWLTLLVPNEYLSGSEIPTNQLNGW